MKTFWNVSAKGTVGRIDIYDYIDFLGVTAQQFSKDWTDLEEKSKSIEVHINSPGGNLFDGITIYNRIQHSKVPVSVFIDGLAASSASIIAMAGDKNYMASNAMLMIHNPSTGTYGNEQDHESTIVMLKAAKKALMVSYLHKTGKAEDEIAALLDANNGAGTWMTADEAQLAGFVDEVIDELKIAAKFDLNDYGYDVPAPLLARFEHKAPDAPAGRKKEVIKMADENKPDANTPATLEELKALCEGATPDFLLKQLEAKATGAQAMKAWMGELKAAAEKARQEVEAANKAKDEAETKAQTQPKPGAKPLRADAGKTDDESDPVERFASLVNAKVQGGMDREHAVRVVAKANKELHRDFLLATNKGLKARRQIQEKYDS